MSGEKKEKERNENVRKRQTKRKIDKQK